MVTSKLLGCFLQIAPFSSPGKCMWQYRSLLAMEQEGAPGPPALGLQRGGMQLQRVTMVTGTFLIIILVDFNHCSERCTTKQLSKRLEFQAPLDDHIPQDSLEDGVCS